MSFLDWFFATNVGNIVFLGVVIGFGVIVTLISMKKQRQAESDNRSAKDEIQQWMSHVEMLLEEIRDELRERPDKDA